jgi:AbiTii/Putative DNA-binding domain
MPEQWKQDCKSTLRLDNPYLKAELIKDIVSIANSPGDQAGYLFFGVDLAADNPIAGLSQTYDDATLQQIVAGRVDRPVSFLYYEVAVGEVTVGVVAIPPSRRRPHIIRADYEHLREGTILVRRGSSTTFANADDIREMIAGSTTSEGQEIRDIIRSAGDDAVKTSTLALQAWDLSKRLGADETSSWLKSEIIGFTKGDMSEIDIPEYRDCQAFVTFAPINPYALLHGGLDVMAARSPEDFQETTIRFGHSLSQLEEIIAGVPASGGILYRRKTMPTTDGNEAEVWFNFKPDSISWILRRIRDRICSSLMDLEAKAN